MDLESAMSQLHKSFFSETVFQEDRETSLHIKIKASEIVYNSVCRSQTC